MKCSDIQSKLSFYVDELLTTGDVSSVDEHLAVCPLCRQQTEEIRTLKLELRRIGRPELPAAASHRIKLAVRKDIRTGRAGSISIGTREWIGMRLMPLTVGIVASLVIGVSFLTMMFTAARSAGDIAVSDGGSDTRIMIAANRSPFGDDGSTDILPADYARNRISVAGESPSINPKGALIALTRSLMRGNMKDDEVVVVADVFSNGLARITQVVEPSSNGRAVGELEKALESDPAYAPFVPAVMDNRSDSVRVILKFQTVDVSTRTPRKRK